MSGYDLAKRFEHSLSRILPARSNQIYTELNKLVDIGFVVETGASARNRRELALTAKGMTALRDWLMTTDGDRAIRVETLLKAHFLWTLPEADARRFFSREAELYRAEAKWLDEQRATLPARRSGSLAYRGKVAAAGAELLRGMAAFCDQMSTDLPGSAPPSLAAESKAPQRRVGANERTRRGRG
jgi:PadR family transcriptional regulator, regulatory protein AphA